ncbi:MAG: hypothetical protein ACI9UQ_000074 [Candidatus Krumholzibacteriia bacterium]
MKIPSSQTRFIDTATVLEVVSMRSIGKIQALAESGRTGGQSSPGEVERGGPKRIIAFILEPPVIERLLTHVGEPATTPGTQTATQLNPHGGKIRAPVKGARVVLCLQTAKIRGTVLRGEGQLDIRINRWIFIF